MHAVQPLVVHMASVYLTIYITSSAPSYTMVATAVLRAMQIKFA